MYEMADKIIYGLYDPTRKPSEDTASKSKASADLDDEPDESAEKVVEKPQELVLELEEEPEPAAPPEDKPAWWNVSEAY